MVVGHAVIIRPLYFDAKTFLKYQLRVLKQQMSLKDTELHYLEKDY